MYNKCLIFVHFLLLSSNVFAQNKFDDIIESIKNNNKDIIAKKSLVKMDYFNHKIGLYPNNPTVEFRNYFGQKSESNEIEFSVIQSFDFPSSYFYKSDIANLNIAKSNLENKLSLSEIINNSKKVVVDYIYQSKIEKLLTKKLLNLDTIISLLKQRFELKDINLLTMNKANLSYFSTRAELNRIRLLKANSVKKIVELNGGKLINLEDADYPSILSVVKLDSLIQEYKVNDIYLAILNQNCLISKSEYDLRKSLNYPKLELGYVSKYIADENYKGAHFGITLPLWENINTLNTIEAKIQYCDDFVNAYKNKIENELSSLSFSYSQLLELHNEYKNIILNYNNIELLNKSLELGQIPAIDFFIELNNNYEIQEKYLSNEKEIIHLQFDLLKYSDY